MALSAATITFSIVDGIAIRPLPYASPERLIGISAPGAKPGTFLPVTPQDYFLWLDGTGTFESLAASRPTTPLRLRIGAATETFVTRIVTANLFGVLGIRPAVGQLFGPQHGRSGGTPAIIMSHHVWVQTFGADAGIIGRRLRFEGSPREVVGVLPPDVWYPMERSPADIYVPYIASATEMSNAQARSMSVVGRLRHGVTLEQARADIVRMSSSAVAVVPLEEQVGGPARQWLFLGLTSVAFVVLIASVNVGVLFLIRAAIRAPEFATRTALGAPALGIALSVLLEGVILAVAAASAGIVASIWGLDVAKVIMPPELPARSLTIRIDARIVSVSLACAVVCGLVCTGVAAWHSARTSPMWLMKEHGNHILGVGWGNRLLGSLVVIEVTSTCVLLVATLLAVQSFRVIMTMDLGFERNNIMTIGYERPFKVNGNFAGLAEVAAFRSHLLERARSVRGITGAAISTTGTAPMSGGSVRYSIVIPGFGTTDRDNMLEMRAVTADYFRVMGMQLVRGRLFEPADRAGSPLVMLLNDVAASRFFAGGDAVGQVVNFRGPTTIIGVLRGVRFDGPESEIRPEMYVPVDQEPLRDGIESGTLFLRTSGNPRGIDAAVRDALRPALGGLEPGQTRVVDDLFRRATAARRFNARTMAILGLIAVVLCGAGIHGTMAFLVASQVPVMGLRLALGASRWQIIRSVLSRASSAVTIGIALGLGIARHSSRTFEPLAFGVRPADAWIYVGVASFVACIGVLAALGPALHASRLDPLVALRRR